MECTSKNTVLFFLCVLLQNINESTENGNSFLWGFWLPNLSGELLISIPVFRKVQPKKTAAATVRESETSTLYQSAFSTTALLPSVRALLPNKQVNVIFMALLQPKPQNFVRGLKTKNICSTERLKVLNTSPLPYHKMYCVLSSPKHNSRATLNDKLQF